MTFSMFGRFQSSYRLIDGNSLRSDSVNLETNLAEGTGPGQANGYWSGTLSIPSGDDETIDLLALAVSAFGASGTTAFASIKHLVIQNTSDKVACTVEPGAANGWDQIGATSLGASGILHVWSPGSGLPVGGSARTLTVANAGTVTTLAGDTTSASQNVMGLSSTSGLAAGMTVTGTGIPAWAKIASVTNGTSLALTANATATGTGVNLNFAWPDAVVRVYVAGILD